MGYAGGQKERPTYHALGAHAETIQMDFDPDVISYGDLLELFWDAHDPHARQWSRQYASILFVHDDTQRKAALASKQGLEAASGRPVQTAIVTLERFWRAEDYHQKHSLQNDWLLGPETRDLFPDPRALTDSTAAARINGILAGYGNRSRLLAEIDDYGLSERGRERLLSVFEP